MSNLVKLGKVYLGTKVLNAFPAAAQFDNDPKIAREWPLRRAVMENIGGGVTHQDFGRYAADLRLTLTSDGNFISQENKAYLDTLAGVRGAEYDYQDYMGIEATVVILEWSPMPTFIGDRPRGVMYEYQLVLQVLEMTVHDFAQYEEGEEE